MKFARFCSPLTFCTILALLLLAVAAQEEGATQPEASQPVVDCTAECAQQVSDAVAPLQTEKTALAEQLYSSQQDFQAAQERVRQLEEEVSELIADKKAAQNEVAQFRQSLDKARDEAIKFHQQADENMRASIDFQTKLAAAESRSSELQEELMRAKEQISELESISFVKQLEKELNTLWTGTKSSLAMIQSKFSGSKKDEDL